MPSLRNPQGPFRRMLLLAALLFLAATFVIWSTSSSNTGSALPAVKDTFTTPVQHDEVDRSILTGHAIAPKLGNETAKAELGRAAWKLLHTMMARFPDTPTTDEKSALKSYVHLFQRLYPCGECAEHFGAILKKFPPQVASRSVAAAWACHVHNEVNKSLKKDLFDCTNIGDFYDCGCAEDEEPDAEKKATKAAG